MDHEPRAVRVQSPFARPREPSILVAAVVVFLLVALLKPWSFGESPSASRSSAGAAVASGRQPANGSPPSPRASAVRDPNTMDCLADPAEQVVILERWAGHEVRSWVAAADVDASGPLDDRLEPISFFSIHVIGLGICAPNDRSGDRAAARFLGVQSIVQTDAGALAVDLGQPDALTRQPGGAELAVLYGAPDGAGAASPVRSSPAGALPDAAETNAPIQAGNQPPGASSERYRSNGDPASWPVGSYAIAFRFASDGARDLRWLRIDLIQGAGVSN